MKFFLRHLQIISTARKTLAEAHLELSKTSKMELSAKIINGSMFEKYSILDVWLSSEYASTSLYALFLYTLVFIALFSVSLLWSIANYSLKVLDTKRFVVMELEIKE